MGSALPADRRRSARRGQRYQRAGPTHNARPDDHPEPRRSRSRAGGCDAGPMTHLSGKRFARPGVNRRRFRHVAVTRCGAAEPEDGPGHPGGRRARRHGPAMSRPPAYGCCCAGRRLRRSSCRRGTATSSVSPMAGVRRFGPLRRGASIPPRSSSMSTSSPTASGAAVRLGQGGRPRRSGRRLRSGPGLLDRRGRTGLSPGRRRVRHPGYQSAPRGPAIRDAGARARRSRRTDGLIGHPERRPASRSRRTCYRRAPFPARPSSRPSAAVMAPGTRVWVAGEAAAVQRIRRHLFEQSRPPARRRRPCGATGSTAAAATPTTTLDRHGFGGAGGSGAGRWRVGSPRSDSSD